MRTLLLVTALACAQFSLSAAAAADLTAIDQRVLAWRRDFHQHPELGNRETRTAGIVAEQLRALGLDAVRTGVAHTGVTGLLRGGRPGPRLLLRADMDALPVRETLDLPFASKVSTEFRGQQVGVMHACGHDAHTAILLGTAAALVERRAQLAGEVLFLFQPAEEGAPDGETGGATLVLQEGVLAEFKPEAVVGLHVWSALNVGEIGYRRGPFMAASDFFEIVVKGRQTHGSRPWGGVDPVAIGAELVGAAQQIVSREMNISKRPVVLSFGAFNAGIRHNIIPDSAQLIGTIRSFDEGMRVDVRQRLIRVAEHTAAAHGASVELKVPVDAGNPVTINDPVLTDRLLPSLRRVAGDAQVKEIDWVMGAEDFSHYALQVPGLMFFVGSTPRGVDAETAPSNHSPEFFLDEEALKIGLRAMLQIVEDYPGTSGR